MLNTSDDIVCVGNLKANLKYCSIKVVLSSTKASEEKLAFTESDFQGT